MPLYVITGARSDTGEEVITFFCSSTSEAACFRANKDGIFVSKVICADEEASRISSRSIYAAIHGLVDKKEYSLAFSLLTSHNLIPDDFQFADVRWLSPILIQMGRHDMVWRGIQQVKLKPYAGEMYAHEAEVLFLFETEMEITKKEGRIADTLERKVLISLANAIVFKNSFDLKSVKMSIECELDIFDINAPSLDKCISQIAKVAKSKGNAAAVFECHRQAKTICKEIYLP